MIWVCRWPNALYRWFRTLSRDGTWRAGPDELHRRVRAAEGRDPEPTVCSLDAQSVASAEGGEQIGFDKFKHCRGRKRNLVVDTLGFTCARTVTSATVSNRVAGRDVLAQAKDRHRDLVKGWVDGGYANAVDASILDWATDQLQIDLEVVKRSDDIKGFAVNPVAVGGRTHQTPRSAHTAAAPGTTNDSSRPPKR